MVNVSRTASLSLLVAALAAIGPPAALGHSGNSGILVKQDVTIALGEDAIGIEYATELNRQGAYLELLRMDLDGDGKPSQAEQARYFADLDVAVPAGLEVRVDGKEVALQRVGQVELSVPFRKTYRFQVPHAPAWRGGSTVEFYNDNYLDFPGEITITLDPGTGADIVYDSRRDQLEDAAAPALGRQPQQRDVVFRYRGGTGNMEPAEAGPDAAAGGGDDGEAATSQTGHDKNPLGTALLIAGSFALLLGVMLLVFRRGPSPATWPRKALAAAAFASSVCLLACWLFASPQPWRETAAGVPSDVEAGQIFQQLHRNIYAAFEAGGESELYDTLARGLEGRALDEVYGEIYEALMMRGRGYVRFDVRRVKPLSTEVLPATGISRPAFRVRYRWRVYGTVTHFGHTHARVNEYEALYLVEHNGRDWRITDTQLQRNQRVTAGQT